jgi:hypothetical protein
MTECSDLLRCATQSANKQAIIRIGLAQDVSAICLNGKYITAFPLSTKLYAFFVREIFVARQVWWDVKP